MAPRKHEEPFGTRLGDLLRLKNIRPSDYPTKPSEPAAPVEPAAPAEEVVAEEHQHAEIRVLCAERPVRSGR